MNTLRIFYDFLKEYSKSVALLILQVLLCSFITFSFVSNLQSLTDTQSSLRRYNLQSVYALKMYLSDAFPVNLAKNDRSEFQIEYIEKVKESYSFIEGSFMIDAIDTNDTLILIGDIHSIGDNLEGLQSKTLYRGVESHKSRDDSIIILNQPKTITETFPPGNRIVDNNWNKVINLDTQTIYYLSYEDFFEESNDVLYLERMLFNSVLINPSQESLMSFSDFMYQTTQTVIYPTEVMNNPYLNALLAQNVFSLVITILIFVFIIFNIVFFFMSLIEDNQFIFSVYYLLGASKYQLIGAICVLTVFIIVLPLSISWAIATLNPNFVSSLPNLLVGSIGLVTLCILPSVVKFNRNDLSVLIKNDD